MGFIIMYHQRRKSNYFLNFTSENPHRMAEVSHLESCTTPRICKPPSPSLSSELSSVTASPLATEELLPVHHHVSRSPASPSMPWLPYLSATASQGPSALGQSNHLSPLLSQLLREHRRRTPRTPMDRSHTGAVCGLGGPFQHY